MTLFYFDHSYEDSSENKKNWFQLKRFNRLHNCFFKLNLKCILWCVCFLSFDQTFNSFKFGYSNNLSAKKLILYLLLY